MNGKKEPLRIALTLTTGKLIHDRPNRARPLYHTLCKLLQTYDKEFQDYYFYMEMFNKGMVETPMHFHGTIYVMPDKVYEYNRFIREWSKATKTHEVSATNSKVIFTDDDTWLNYCKKHDVIDGTYKQLNYPRLINRETLKKIIKWSKPKSPKDNSIMNLLTEGGGERSSPRE